MEAAARLAVATAMENSRYELNKGEFFGVAMRPGVTGLAFNIVTDVVLIDVDFVE